MIIGKLFKYFLILFILLNIILFVYFINLKNNIPLKVISFSNKFNVPTCESNVNMDICISNRAINVHNPYFCENISNILLKDICYFLAITGGDSIIDIKSSTNSCDLIKNIYLGSLCRRLGYRPHMLIFITTKLSNIQNDFNNIVSDCHFSDKIHNLFCIYAYVAGIAKDHLFEAKKICNKLNESQLIEECKYYIASTFTFNMDENTSNKILIIEELCKEIIDLNWRSECYYVLADELALQTTNYLEKINTACSNSSLAKDYNCFNHVLYLLPPENTIKYCNLIEESRKNDCYKTYARILEGQNEEKVVACAKVPVSYKNSCYVGIGEGAASHIKDTYISNNLLDLSSSEICGRVEEKYVSNCLNGFYSTIADSIVTNVSYRVSICINIPAEYQKGCYYSIFNSNIKYMKYSKTSINYTSLCKEIPVKYANECYETCGEDVGTRFVDNASAIISECNKFPNEYRNKCYFGVGNSLNRYYSNNADLEAEACNQFPYEFQDDCLLNKQ